MRQGLQRVFASTSPNSSLLYNVVSVVFTDDSPTGFEKKDSNTHELLIMVDTSNDSTNTVTASMVTFFNYFIN